MSKKSKQENLILRAVKCIDKHDFVQANKYLQQASSIQGKESYKALILFYYGRMYSKGHNDVVALRYFLAALKTMDEPDNAVSEKFRPEIYQMLSISAFNIGLNREAFYFAGLAYRTATKADTKNMILCRYLYCLVSSNNKPMLMTKELSGIGEKLRRVVLQHPCKKFDAEQRSMGEKIHIAYISPDFRQHVMSEFYSAILRYHDRSKFFVTCVYLNKIEDVHTNQIKNMVDRFEYCGGMAYHELAGKLKSMNIDIAVDLAGYTDNSGIFALAYRVAPVQISGLGWMESTGMKEVDYLITDRYMDEPGQSYITEKPLYLNSCFCFTPGKNKENLPASTGAPCRKKGYITFGSFNRLIKITDEMLIAWREIMKAVPNSRLLLKSLSFAHESTCQYTLDRMEKLGMDRHRIILEAPSKEYMERYLDVDIALDTYPYCGGGTTCDALYMGVPVVSLYGKRRSSNFGRSILSAAGLGELAVNNADEYVNLAISLAKDWDTLDMLHKNLRSMMQKSDLMNGEKYTKELEAQYEEILKQKIAE